MKRNDVQRITYPWSSWYTVANTCLYAFTYCLAVGATEQEIKDRYTKLALNWYPDKPAEEKDNSVVTEVV